MDEGKVRCVRLVAIFVLGGLLILNVLLAEFRHTHAGTASVVLYVLLLVCMFAAFWSPVNRHSPDDDHDHRGYHHRSSDVSLLAAEAPPSYDEVVGLDGHVEGQVDSHLVGHLVAPALTLSVDGLPSYEAAIATEHFPMVPLQEPHTMHM